MAAQNREKTDFIENIGKSVIQHGKNNDRVYLIKLDSSSDKQQIIEYIEKLCSEKSYAKVFAKLRASDYPLFFLAGYRIEAYIPRFFRGVEDCIFACRYHAAERKVFAETEPGAVLAEMLGRNKKGVSGKSGPDENKFTAVRAAGGDAAELAAFYSGQFPNYPFPLDDPAYVLETMESNVDYFIIRENGRIIGAASGEKDVNELNAEITDFAVNPAYRGHGLAGLLMKAVESYLGSETDIKTLYTIARLNSPAMNAVFLKNSYSYSGTLLNNTNISTGIESMNVWYKHI